MLILTKEDIAAVCSMKDAIEAVKEAFFEDQYKIG